MHKRPRPSKLPKRDKRKNPAFGNAGITKMLTDSAGTLMVTAALMGCTFEEKAIIASLIPSALAIIRSAPRASVKQVVDRLFEETDDDSHRALQRRDRETGEPND